jgi:hypothetical protein
MCEKFIQPQLWGTVPSAFKLDTSLNIAFDKLNRVSTVKKSDTIKPNVRNFIETYCDSIQVSNIAFYAIHQDTRQNTVINCLFHSNPSHLVDYPHSSPKTFTTPELLTSNLGSLRSSRGVMLQTFLSLSSYLELLLLSDLSLIFDSRSDDFHMLLLIFDRRYSCYLPYLHSL